MQQNGRPLTPANARCLLRWVFSLDGLSGSVLQVFQCSVTTAINEQGSMEPVNELHGHTVPRITIQHSIRRSGMAGLELRVALVDAL